MTNVISDNILLIVDIIIECSAAVRNNNGCYIIITDNIKWRVRLEDMERVFEIIEEQLHLSGMELSEDLSLKDDLGADSIDLVELVMALEDEYGIEMQYEELEKRVKTIGDIIEYLSEQGADI